MLYTRRMGASSRFAVFDIDGTLLRWQLFHGMIDALAKEGLLGDRAYEQIREARLHWKRRTHPEAFEHYQDLMVGLYFKALAQIPPDRYDAAVHQTITKYKDQAYTYTKGLLQRLKADGYLLFAISGSHDELVERLAQHYGFDDWRGTRYERKDGAFTGVRVGAYQDKHIVLRQLVEKHAASWAGSVGVGDTGSDISMLELVETPIAFNPDRALFGHATKKGWKLVIERKNVIYELESNHGQYLLAQANY